MGGERNTYWLARQLERENVQMLAILEELARYPVATIYPDGPCIERTDMDDIKAAIAAASRHKEETQHVPGDPGSTIFSNQHNSSVSIAQPPKNP